MEVTLNNVKSLDHLGSIIAKNNPSVEMHRSHLSLKYQGTKLTIEPKKDGKYDINKDVPIFKGLLLAVITIIALYGIAALTFPQALAHPMLLIFTGAVICIAVFSIFNHKTKPVLEKFCQELVDLCKDQDTTK